MVLSTFQNSTIQNFIPLKLIREISKGNLLRRNLKIIIIIENAFRAEGT